ncbi:hypothetical protein [Asticcacaulis sp. AC466]|uniref:hypothetical protein n=1 Tax=Asticcacaulis sp. AC466 TaxID=1282362 RepID=UPI0003F68A6E|nr:hypothetical protein [Asticcacaulis sp. AC466]
MSKDPLDDQVTNLNGLLNRVTEKTGGVLAVASIVFAVSIGVLDKAIDAAKEAGLPAQQFRAPAGCAVILCFISICFLMVCIICLCANLTTVWRKDNSNWKPNQDVIALSLNLFARRTIRLQISLYGILLSIGLSLLALGFLESDLLGQFGQACLDFWAPLLSSGRHLLNTL